MKIQITNNESIDEFCEKHYKKILFIFIILIIISRIYKFGELPRAIGVDEAGAAYDAYCLANYGVDRYLNSFPLYLVNFGGGQSSLYAYLSVIFIKLFGSNIVSYRLPALLIFCIGIICSYLLIEEYKDKKTALLFTFLIIICPWHIIYSRIGLDCNLLSGMFMLDLYLLHKAKKNYQYIIAGIMIGLTLYTYALTYIIIPMFLLVWIIYMLYMRKIKIKQVILLGIPIFLLALPLMYMILLNNNIFDRTQFGIFTIPKLPEYRENEVNISNIWKFGLQSLKTTFLTENTIYYIQIPLFILGLILETIKTVKEIKKREFSIDSVLTLSFYTILVANLTVGIWTVNKINIIYIYILYFTTIGILKIVKESWIANTVFLSIFIICFINFEMYYYFDYSQKIHSVYEDKELYYITDIIQQDPRTNELEKYIINYNIAEPYIYTILKDETSPYEFDKTKVIKEVKNEKIKFKVLSKYKNYNFQISKNDLKNLDFEKGKYVFVINKNLKDMIELIVSKNYVKEDYGIYSILKPEI